MPVRVAPGVSFAVGRHRPELAGEHVQPSVSERVEFLGGRGVGRARAGDVTDRFEADVPGPVVRQPVDLPFARHQIAVDGVDYVAVASETAVGAGGGECSFVPESDRRRRAELQRLERPVLKPMDMLVGRDRNPPSAATSTAAAREQRVTVPTRSRARATAATPRSLAT